MRPRGLAALSAPRRYADPLGLGGGNLGATVRYSCRSGRTSWSATAFSRTHLGSERSRWWKTYVLDANRRPADEPTEVCGGALRRPHRAGGRLIAGGSEPPALARFQQPPQRQNHHLPRRSPTTTASPSGSTSPCATTAPSPAVTQEAKKPREQGRPPRTDSNLVRARPDEHIWRHLRDQRAADSRALASRPRGLHHTLSGVIHRSCPQACAGVCGFVECRHSPCAQDPFETSNSSERSRWGLPTNPTADLGASSL